jgi:hypothetical protein
MGGEVYAGGGLELLLRGALGAVPLEQKKPAFLSERGLLRKMRVQVTFQAACLTR